MKKILILLILIVSVIFVFCGCKSDENDAIVPVTDPSVTSNEGNNSVDKENIDWETPIDVDDSFAEDTNPNADTPTDPSEETGPLSTVSDPENTEDPTNPTDPDVTEAPTDGTTEPTSTSSGSGPIELPMIPG